MSAIERNCREFGVTLLDLKDSRQGIVHVVGPELGLTQPGMTIVCGDSHTATHGAFGALAHGIGTSEVEHVLATQTLIQKKSKNMKVEVKGSLGPGVTAKDIAIETNLYVDWKVNANVSLSVVGAYANPGEAIVQNSGRTKNFAYGMVYVGYSY